MAIQNRRRVLRVPTVRIQLSPAKSLLRTCGYVDPCRRDGLFAVAVDNWRDDAPPSAAQRYSAVSSLQQLGPNFLLRKESGAQLIIAFHRAEERTGP